MTSRAPLLGTLALSLLVCSVATAQSRFELTPFAGYRLGGELDDFDFGDTFDFEDAESFGVVLDFALGGGAFVELLFSGQETELESDSGLFIADESLFDVDIDYWHVGGLYQWEIGQVIPFVVGTVGLTELDPAPARLSSETRFSIGLGAGVKLMFGDHLGLRFEVRGFTTFFDSNDEVFCDPFVCYGYRDTEYLWQLEARAGLVLAF